MALQVYPVLPWPTETFLSADAYASALEVLLPLTEPGAAVIRVGADGIVVRRTGEVSPTSSGGVFVVAASAVSDVALQLFEEGVVDVGVRGALQGEVVDTIREELGRAVKAGRRAVIIADSEVPGVEGAVVVEVSTSNEIFLLSQLAVKAGVSGEEIGSALAAASARTSIALIDPDSNSGAEAFSLVVSGPDAKTTSSTKVSTASAAVAAALAPLVASSSSLKNGYAVQVSALNGLATINFGIVVADVLTQLEALVGIRPAAVFTSHHATSGGSFGFAVTLADASSLGVAAPVMAEGPANLDDEVKRQRCRSGGARTKKSYTPAARAAVEAACRRLILSEPEITRMDTIAGDGDCGTTLRAGATAVLQRVLGIASIKATADGDCDITPDTTPASSDDGHAAVVEEGTLVNLLYEVADALEASMGGTSGIVLTILFRSWAREAGGAHDIGASLSRGLETLMRYTPARRNDRTLLDALIPFAEALEGSALEEGWKGRVGKAVAAAREGCEATKGMRPGLGRAIYVPREGIEGVPDAGALGVLRVVEGVEAAVEGEDV
jgi:hypothetical protein